MDDKEFRDRNGGRQEGAAFAFTVLCALNYLNYMDRYVPAAVKDLIIDDLNLTDTESSLPATVSEGILIDINPFLNCRDVFLS